MIVLPELPYAYDALAPVISSDTLHFHHDKHHATYVKTVNELLAPSSEEPRDLEAIVADAHQAGNKKLFNNAAQAWNHAFFWVSMSPDRQSPNEELSAAIGSGFGDLPGLRKTFVTEGAGHFGSGWVWLVAKGGALEVISTHDAADTLTEKGLTPLLVCDLWEHAYYLDHKNDRKGFLEAWFDALPNWELAALQWAAARAGGGGWQYPSPARAMAAE
jgi:superoxide dismutase, Fe-Mn family